MSVYELIAMASKKLNSRQAKKAVCRELFQINGETVFDPYTSLRVGDVVRFKNRNYEMLMEKDGTIGI
jgi:ribosomal protein S4